MLRSNLQKRYILTVLVRLVAAGAKQSNSSQTVLVLKLYLHNDLFIILIDLIITVCDSQKIHK